MRERDVRKLEGAVEELKQQHTALDDVFQQELGARFLELKNALREETQVSSCKQSLLYSTVFHFNRAICRQESKQMTTLFKH